MSRRAAECRQTRVAERAYDHLERRRQAGPRRAEAWANHPSTFAALAKRHQTLVQRDATRPVFSVETMIGIAAAAIAGSPVAVAVGAGRITSHIQK